MNRLSKEYAYHTLAYNEHFYSSMIKISLYYQEHNNDGYGHYKNQKPNVNHD
jgi:hypothetical protein